MKHIAIVALVAAATLIMAGSAYAQQKQVEQANIPFSFTVNNSQLPSGNYTIWTSSSMPGVINLESRENGVHVLALSMATQSAPQNSSVLEFHKYGQQYFLSDIRSAESSTDAQFSMGRAEKRAKADAEEAGLRLNTHRTVALNTPPSR